jgi:hypothetical protein
MADPKAKELVKKEEAGLPAVIDFVADSGAGFEDSDKESYAIPFLSILQSGSPQCKRSDGAYIKGAEEGMLYNSVTGEVTSGDEGILVVPCYYTRNFIEWIPRSDGGGINGTHTVAEAEILSKTLKTIKVMDNGKEKEIQVLPNGNTLSDTRNHYLIHIKPNGDICPLVAGMSSSQIKASKKWMTLMQGIRIQGKEAPMFSQIYKITTIPLKNNEGSWYGFKIDHVKQIDNVEIYNAAKEFRELVKSGNVKIDGQETDISPSSADPEAM